MSEKKESTISLRRSWHITLPAAQLKVESSPTDVDMIDFVDLELPGEEAILSMSWSDLEAIYLTAKAERERLLALERPGGKRDG
jgi:hypothetical protein